MLARHGYGVLMLDMRGYGASDGDPNMFGWGATQDIDAGVGFLRARHDVREGRVGGIGFSVGGELMLEAAAGNAGLRAVVADRAGERSVRESALRGVEGALALPAAAVQTAAVTVLSGELPPPSLVDLIPRIPRARCCSSEPAGTTAARTSSPTTTRQQRRRRRSGRSPRPGIPPASRRDHASTRGG